MAVSCEVWDVSNEKISYNHAIIKCELIKISHLHNYDHRIIFSIFSFSETFYANFDSNVVVFKCISVDHYHQTLFETIMLYVSTPKKYRWWRPFWIITSITFTTLFWLTQSKSRLPPIFKLFSMMSSINVPSLMLLS